MERLSKITDIISSQSKGSLVGHSDKNAAEDTGKLHVTYANNHFYNVRSRGPLLRFGTAHIFKSVLRSSSTVIRELKQCTANTTTPWIPA